MTEQFKKQLEDLININGVDTLCNRPDYVLAEMVCKLLEWFKLEKKDGTITLDDLENARAVQGIRQEKCAKLEKENKLLKARKEELNENCYGLAKENKELKKKLDKLRTDNIYEEGLYN